MGYEFDAVGYLRMDSFDDAELQDIELLEPVVYADPPPLSDSSWLHAVSSAVSTATSGVEDDADGSAGEPPPEEIHEAIESDARRPDESPVDADLNGAAAHETGDDHDMTS